MFYMDARSHKHHQLTLVPAAVFLATFAGNWGGGILPPGMPLVLEHIATKFQRLSPCVLGKLFNDATSVSRDVDIRPRWRSPK